MLTAPDFLDLVRRSSLVEEDQLTKFLVQAAARNGSKATESAESLSAELIRARLLTDWQAEKLLAGRWKGFILDEFILMEHRERRASCQVYLAFDTIAKVVRELWVTLSSRIGDDSVVLDRLRAEAESFASKSGIEIARHVRSNQFVRYLIVERPTSC